MATLGRYYSEVPDWRNLEVIHRNTLPPRSTFFLYDTEADALTYDNTKSKSICLSGTWKFHLANSPFEAPEDFYSPTFDTSSWQDIVVPNMWQLQTHIKSRGPQYTNTVYPFPVDPPNVPSEDNETGSYMRRFELPTEMEGCQIRLRFEGVDSAFHVWVNGTEVGYSQGSRNPSEFDIGSFLHSGRGNTVAVRVYQWSDGSYIEDQDQWWLSGIFRDVYLLAFPKVHFQDFHVQTILDDDYRNATLSVKIKISGAAEVNLKLLESSKSEILSQTKHSSDGLIHFELPVENPEKWTAETPYLYHLLLSFSDGKQVIAQRVGFRRTEIKDGLLLVNGKRIVFKGANRHEHHPTGGRTVPLKFLKHDLLLMKTHNLNAIRTSHQPNDPRLYDLADELGFWIIDEADLECHGFADIEENAMTDEQKKLSYAEKKILSYEAASKWTTDNPDWREAYEDRARQLVMRDKNYPSIIMWSLGNEAFYGRNFQNMYDLIKSIDSSRPIHYEGDIEAKTVDLFSLMYPSVSTIVQLAEVKDYTKPLILCEYIHAMGNGPGAIKEYIDAFYKYPRLQGGFVWEWANHGLLTKNEKGEEYYAYGGDFGEQVHDSNFVMDGILFSNHTPSPGLIEYKKAIEPVQVLGLLSNDPMRIEIVNRYDFLTLDHLDCVCTLIGDGFEQKYGRIQVPHGLQPGKTAELVIEGLDLVKAKLADTYLTVCFVLKENTLWAKAGHEVAWAQVKTSEPSQDLCLEPAIKHESNLSITKLSRNLLSIKGTTSTWKFDAAKGSLISWTKISAPEIENFAEPPVLDFYRAPTDNDEPSAGFLWKDKRLHQTKPYIQSVTSTHENGAFIITTKARIAPPVLEWAVHTETTYTITDTHLHLHVSGNPSGKNLPRTFARIGLTIPLSPVFKDVTYFGRGPGEAYIDKKQSQRFGTWSMPIEDLWTPYEYPQESGNRTDVKHITFTGFHGEKKEEGEEVSAKMSFGKQEGCSFSASHYKIEDVDAARHPFELEKKRREEVIVRLDWRHMGLGTASCGPGCLSEYELKSEPFEFDVTFE